MADALADVRVSAVGRRAGKRPLVRKKSIIAFLFALPLILIVVCLVIYPALYAVSLAMMNKSMQYYNVFTAKNNFAFLFGRNAVSFCESIRTTQFSHGIISYYFWIWNVVSVFVFIPVSFGTKRKNEAVV